MWRTLTEKAKVSLWLFPVTDNIKPIVGHRFAFAPSGGNSADRIDCQIVNVDVGRRLAYTWQPANGEPTSIVTWTLEPTDDGTRVHLRHDGALPGSTFPRLSAALSTVGFHHTSRRHPVGHHRFSGGLLCR